MLNPKSNISLNTVILLLLLALLPFLFASAFVLPMSDDLCFFSKVKLFGFFKAQSYWFNNWTGRYFSTALISLFALIPDNFVAYKLAHLFLILILFISLSVFINELTHSLLSSKNLLLVSMSLLFTYFASLPNLSEGLYWMSGTFSYLAPNAILLMLCTIITRVYKENNKRFSAPKLVISSCLVCFIVGSSETSMFQLLLILSAIFLVDLYYLRRVNIFLLLLILTTIIFSTIVLCAPGNEIRLNYYPKNRASWSSILRALEYGSIHILTWAGSPFVFFLTFAFVSYLASINQKKIILSTINPAIILIILFAITIFTFFPPIWSLGTLPPDRTINSIFFVFLIGWFINVQIAVQYIANKYHSQLGKISKNKIHLFAIMCMGYFLYSFSLYIGSENNVKLLYSDLINGDLYRFDKEQRERYKKITHSNYLDCEVESLINRPKSIFTEDLNYSPGDWINKCLADYMGKRSIYMLKRPNVNDH